MSAIEALITASTSPDGRLLLERFLRLVEEAHVLDRDHRLVAEGLQQCNFPLAERPYLPAPQQDRSECMPLAEERHHGDSTMAEAPGNLVLRGYSARGRANRQAGWSFARAPRVRRESRG